MKVSVVMPVYNAAGKVAAALDSLRTQTLQPLEIIVVNDGSTDGTLELLHRQRDIVLLDHSHRGIAAALNDGLAAASGDYIARMDPTDLCMPQRLEMQASFLDVFADTGLVGCRVACGEECQRQAGRAAHVDWINSLVDPTAIALSRFVESPFAHSSVMFRRALPERFGGYRAGPFPEDYELWLRWMANGVKAGKVDEELLVWNNLPEGLSRTATDVFLRIKAEYLALWLKKNNPHHPEVVVWGAGRGARKRAAMLEEFGVNIAYYIDNGTPDIDPSTCFVLPMVDDLGVHAEIVAVLSARGFAEGESCIMAA